MTCSTICQLNNQLISHNSQWRQTCRLYSETKWAGWAFFTVTPAFVMT